MALYGRTHTKSAARDPEDSVAQPQRTRGIEVVRRSTGSSSGLASITVLFEKRAGVKSQQHSCDALEEHKITEDHKTQRAGMTQTHRLALANKAAKG